MEEEKKYVRYSQDFFHVLYSDIPVISPENQRIVPAGHHFLRYGCEHDDKTPAVREIDGSMHAYGYDFQFGIVITQLFIPVANDDMVRKQYRFPSETSSPAAEW